MTLIEDYSMPGWGSEEAKAQAEALAAKLRAATCPTCGQRMEWEDCLMCDGDGQSLGEWTGLCVQCNDEGGAWNCKVC